MNHALPAPLSPAITDALAPDQDESERPTLSVLHPFDRQAEHFFSNAETLPELLPDARFLAQLAAAGREVDHDDGDPDAWWRERRRASHLRLVVMLCAACVALLGAGVLR